MARQSHARKVFVAGDKAGRSATPDWEFLRFEIFAADKDEEGNPVVIETVTIDPSEYSDAMIHCAAGYGLSQKLGDAYANLDKKAEERGFPFDDERGYADCIMDILAEWDDNLKQGVWITERESSGRGTSVTILAEAICAALEDAGQEITDEIKATVVQNCTEEAYREGAKKRADVQMHYARITAERAAERAKKAAEKAKEADTSDISGLL